MKRSKSKLTLGSFVVLIVLLAIVGFFQLSGVNTSSPNEVTPTTLSESTQESGWYQVYFTYPGFSGPQVQTHLIKLIDEANLSVDLAVFEFNLDDVTQALIRAHERGVNVRIVYDSEHADSEYIGKLKDVGISVVPDNRSAFMHNKFFIIDKKIVWTGSFNISVNAATKNYEDAVVIYSSDLAKNYTIEFEEMFLDHKFGPSSPQNTDQTLYVGHTKIENYFSSEDGVMSRIVSAVSGAKKSIHFMAFSFTDNSLSSAMLDRYQNKIEVNGILENLGSSGSGAECPLLLHSGLGIRQDGNGSATFHHKVIIIDGVIVIFGSYNFSAQAEENNDENLLIVYDEGLAQAFEQEFARLWVLSPAATCN